jgi:Nif-specific regulatory protein
VAQGAAGARQLRAGQQVLGGAGPAIGPSSAGERPRGPYPIGYGSYPFGAAARRGAIIRRPAIDPVTQPTPLLIVIAGPARGRSVPLQHGLSIGRDELNALAIPDPALSRRHCVIEVDGDGLLLRDLDSKNGVFVNGCPVTQRPLADGDVIRIGDSAIVVMTAATAARARAGDADATIVDTPVTADSTIAIERAQRHFAAPSGNWAHDPRAARDRALLFRLSTALQGTTSSAGLYDLVLTHALEVAPAGGAAIVAVPAGDDVLGVVATKAAAGRDVTVWRAVAEQAIAERAAVAAREPPALCVPLPGSDTAQAALCLGAPSGTTFAEDDVRLLAAVGSIAGLALQRVRLAEWLSDENARLRKDAAIAHNLVGESAPMQAVFRFIARVAATDATVLLRGESGTGKELAAHAIHANSARARGPFVAINCAALPEALLESELFGHERGAFTGALGQQRGRLELADRGTVFLDEIGELAPALQAKLLRVLEDRMVERLGARRGIRIDVRVIAATNRDLEAAMAQGAFRKDLYYRLNVVSLTIPSLKERRDDLPLLAAYFVRKHAAGCKRNVKGISPAARALLARYDWPGNVRELSNVIERAVVLGSSDVILPEDLPETLLESHGLDDTPTGYHARVAAHKRDLIVEALERHGGSVAAAARELALQPTYLHRLIRHLGVRASSR